jgi:hypothetical protein
MADTSARWQISEPSADRHDAADVPLYVRNIVAALEARGPIFGQGPIASRPAFGTQGRLYASTDETPNGLYYDTGSAWFKIGSLATGAVGTAQIADGSITLPKMAPGSVDSSKIIDGTIVGADIADGSIAANELDPSLKPSTGAGAGTEALRSLGLAAGQAASGSHHTQHEAGGADQIVISTGMLDAVTAGLLPQPGDIKWVAYNVVAGSEPAGWLLCDGRVNLSTTTYAALFAKLNYVHGGSGAQFGIPDMRGRGVIGVGTGTGLTARTIGAKGGEESHQLTQAETPSHTHSVSINPGGGHNHVLHDPGHGHTSPVRLADGSFMGQFVVSASTGDNSTTYTGDKWGTSGSIIRSVSGTTTQGTGMWMDGVGDHGHSVNQNSIGSDGYHNNMAPFIVLTPLIKT